jgi:hypothetical protein
MAASPLYIVFPQSHKLQNLTKICSGNALLAARRF